MPATRTSQQWWEETRKEPARLVAWLLDQYRGEATAAGRIEGLRDTYAQGDAKARRILTVIAAQERQHARWVGGLLRARGLEPAVQDKAERYWEQPLAAIQDLESGCAVGAHAERMRLERIEVIAADPEAPEDVRAVFRRILPQERFHERAFRALAGATALEATRGAHELGRTALGLSP